MSCHREPNQAQGLPTNQETLDDFVQYIKEKMHVIHIGPGCVANFDETNCYFSPDLAYTIAEKGSRIVSIATSACCMVMLRGLMDRERLSLYVILWVHQMALFKATVQMPQAMAGHLGCSTGTNATIQASIPSITWTQMIASSVMLLIYTT